MGYNPKSCKAEEFINHEEILESLEYAQKNKGNKELIEGILDKANRAKGLTHREAAVLLECDDEELTDRMFKLAEDLKKRFYGNRIVMFAPLYLSNYCVNGCVYCPYHAKNKTIARKKLTQDEIRREVIALQDMGHKRLALEAGEDPVNNPIEYILECINTIYSIKPVSYTHLLIVPNLVSLYKGDNVHENILDTALFGAIFVLFCDILARVFVYPYELSVGLTVEMCIRDSCK